MIDKNLLVKMRKIFLNTMLKNSSIYSYRYREIVKNPNDFTPVMTSMTMFTRSQSPFNFARI